MRFVVLVVLDTRTSLVSIHKMWVMKSRNAGKFRIAPMSYEVRSGRRCCCVNRQTCVKDLFQALKPCGKEGDWITESDATG